MYYIVREMRNAYNYSDRSEEKRPVTRCVCKWDDSINVNLKEIFFSVWTVLNWLKAGSIGRPM
jgi:hypothetical protein